MSTKKLGFHHVGLATHNMEATLDFYARVLGFDLQVADVISPEAGGAIRHAFLNAGEGQMLAFMECNEVPGIADDFDTGINRGLGIAGGVMHFAFKAANESDLEERRRLLAEHGVKVTDVVDHGWCKSIYFRDPNQLQLEFCVVTEDLEDGHLADAQSDIWRNLSRS